MSETESVALSMMPNLEEEGKKGAYLAKRICNFSVRESCQLAKVSEKSVRRWREADPEFARIDGNGLTELRKRLANEYVDMEFTRNFHLVLQKDFEILYKSATGAVLTEKEEAYLLKIRAHYTPQSLAMVKQLLGGGTTEEPFNFSRYVLSIRREREEIRLEER